jgi:hypothetical protein
MRRRASLVALALAAGLGAAGPAVADPSDVYVDYATDGTIECTHSRGDLEGILTDASINEYGDPLTLTRLRIAVRRQLAAGCVRGGTAPATATAPDDEDEAAPDAGPASSADDGPSEGQGAESASTSTTTETAATTATEPGDGETATQGTPEASTATEQDAPEATTVAAGPAAGDGDGGTSTALVGGGVLAIGLLAAGGWLARRSLTRSP